MSIDTWNVQGLAHKLNEVIQEVKLTYMDIITLTQTKNKGNGNQIYGYHILMWSGDPKS